jgi:hypothetical protein
MLIFLLIRLTQAFFIGGSRVYGAQGKYFTDDLPTAIRLKILFGYNSTAFDEWSPELVW